MLDHSCSSSGQTAAQATVGHGSPVNIRSHEVDRIAWPRIAELVAEIDSTDLSEHDAYRRGVEWAARLPGDLIATVLEFARLRTTDALVVRGLPLGRIEHEPTPLRHGDVRSVSGFEGVCLAVSLLTGSPFGYANQQRGRLLNDIVPIEAGSNIPNFSGGFTDRFQFHTEDAFLQHPPDFIQLACVRNPTQTPLTLAGVNAGDIDDETDSLLRQPDFVVGVNPGQREWTRYAAGAGPLLSGPRTRPWLRYNKADTTNVSGRAGALESMHEVLERNAQDVALEPGDIVLVDNARLVHARTSYDAKCDGTDRWLLRLVTYRNLRNAAGDHTANPAFPILTSEGIVKNDHN